MHKTLRWHVLLNIHVPGEPGNEATSSCFCGFLSLTVHTHTHFRTLMCGYIIYNHVWRFKDSFRRFILVLLSWEYFCFYSYPGTWFEEPWAGTLDLKYSILLLFMVKCIVFFLSNDVNNTKFKIILQVQLGCLIYFCGFYLLTFQCSLVFSFFLPLHNYIIIQCICQRNCFTFLLYIH